MFAPAATGRALCRSGWLRLAMLARQPPGRGPATWGAASLLLSGIRHAAIRPPGEGGPPMHPQRAFSSAVPSVATGNPAAGQHHGDAAECAGTRLCQAIELGEAPLPQGFDDVEHFRLFLRLAGDPRANRPLASSSTIGRLLGMDRLSVQALLSRYTRDYGIAPPRRSGHIILPGLGPGHPVFEDLMVLARRDPPVVGLTLARLVCLPPRQVDELLSEHMPELLEGPTFQRNACIRRLKQLVNVVPPLSYRMMCMLLSIDQNSVMSNIRRHMPEYADRAVARAPADQLETMRRLLSDRSLDPLPSPREVYTQSGLSKSTFDIHGPSLHAEYMIRLRGALPPEKLASMRALLQERRHTLRTMADELGMTALTLRWYIRHYEPEVIVPARNNIPIRHLSLPPDRKQLTLTEYTRRFLPAESPVHGLPDAELATRLSAKGLPSLRHYKKTSFNPLVHCSGPGTDLRPLAKDLDAGLESRVLALAGMRPALTRLEISEQLATTHRYIADLVQSSSWPADFWLHGSRRVTPPTREEIRSLRRLASEVHPAGGRMKYTVPELAAAMGWCPDRLYHRLHECCPEYFFLALAPEAGSGPGGMYVPEGKLDALLAAVEGQYPTPVLHQVAADLGCALPQVVNSLRAHARRQGGRFTASRYAQHSAGRVFELKHVFLEDPALYYVNGRPRLCPEASRIYRNAKQYLE
ncbi:hypothetical protein H696_04677 [Fonticula alba]|uniref:Uncharacterized protein n=1 Tax=Fonticula alba TaxID=691883 RepID=A0A058Z4N0_FONAL|nr:hypothetical protein H696_04677 [Fonticula alba]KCV69249.1 hypothetical protein H696_04677 [Fonticula alba]|eukprot:XP_009496820.1 hypothetical protein H696_04677 [Fonticula alba]